MRVALSIVLVLAMLAFAAPLRAEMVGGLTVGDVAPEGKVVPLGGSETSLGAAQGSKVLLFVIFETTCPHCQVETKALNRIQAELDQTKASILAVSLGETEAKTIRFRDRFKVTYPLALDPKGDLQRPFNIVGVPTYFILGKDRKIRYQGNAESYEVINAQLQKVLAE